MTCTEAELRIIEERYAPELLEHLRGCAACRGFSEIQRRLDALLVNAYPAPALSSAFRRQLRAAVQAEKRRKLLDWLPEVAGFGAGAATTAAGAFLVPSSASFIWTAGLFTSLLAFAGRFAFEWLIEELGEG